MAITIPSDLFLRTLALPVFSYNFYKNMDLMKGFMGEDPMSPIVVDGIDFMASGEYADQPVLKPISSLIQVRDYTSGGSALTAAKLQTRNDNGVFCRFTALVNLGEDASRIAWGTTQQRLVQHFLEQIALEWPALIQTYVIAIAKAAIDNMTSTLHTKNVWNASARTNLSNGLILQGLALLTDKQQQYFGGGRGVLVTRAESNYDLANYQLGAGVQGIADNMVRQGIPQTNGIPYVLAQDASLTVTDAGFDKYITIGIGPGAIRIKLEVPRFYAPDQRLDTVSVSNFLRCDMDVYFEVPGMQYDKTNGGANPSLATIGTSTNWDPTYSDDREIPMFELIHNYSAN